MELKCQWCGATGLTVGGEKHGQLFRDEGSLHSHEAMCKENPKRTRWHKRGHRKEKELLLKVVTELNDGTLLCVNGSGDMFKAERVRVKIETL